MENKHLFCIIMAGGIGSRFWPMSKQNYPKQFLDILGTGRTLLQQTYERFEKLIPKENIYIVTNKSYDALVIEQIPGISNNQILLEPSRRNTAPCIAYAMHKISKSDPLAQIVIAPSDHLILKEDVFLDQIKKAFSFTQASDSLITLGIRPSRPDTGYGYIQFVDYHTSGSFEEVKKVKTFTEKPNLELAKSFLASGDFLWNAGIFICSSASLIASYEQHLPEMNQIFKDGFDVYFTENESAFIERAYTQCTNISVDYAIMEKASNVFVIPSEFGWSDLGTWGSMYENSNKDSNGNAIIGKHVMLNNTKNCVVSVPNEKLVVIQGLEGFIVVESDGILLICKMEDEQEIRQMVTNVKVEKGEEFV
jgi:mannose-1-phosphate guanylyltransferase